MYQWCHKRIARVALKSREEIIQNILHIKYRMITIEYRFGIAVVICGRASLQ